MGVNQSFLQPPPNSKTISQKYSDPNGRILVDIRGANLDHNYNVWIKQQPNRDIETRVHSITNVVQSLGGVLITVLTIQKLWEEIRFLRTLRQQLSSLASVMSANEATGAIMDPHLKSTTQSSLNTETLNSVLPPPESQGVTWNKIAGLTSVKKVLQEATVLPLMNPELFRGIRQPVTGILLFGPPGTGKTMLARAVASESQSAFFPITGSSVLSMWYGQSEQNVKALFEKARKHERAVIFIDEVDSLLSKRSRPGIDSGSDKRVTNEFLGYLDGIQTTSRDSRIVVIAATNYPWELDDAALSRFSCRVYVALPKQAERATLLKEAMKGVETDMSDEDYHQIAGKADMYSGRDLVNVAREASFIPLRELMGERLLESTAVISPQDKLVSLLAENLKHGKKKRLLKKELLLWKSKHGDKVSWCDVDAVLQHAERIVKEAQQGPQTQTTPPVEPQLSGVQSSGGSETSAGAECLSKLAQVTANTEPQACRVGVNRGSGESDSGHCSPPGGIVQGSCSSSNFRMEGPVSTSGSDGANESGAGAMCYASEGTLSQEPLAMTRSELVATEDGAMKASKDTPSSGSSDSGVFAPSERACTSGQIPNTSEISAVPSETSPATHAKDASADSAKTGTASASSSTEAAVAGATGTSATRAKGKGKGKGRDTSASGSATAKEGKAGPITVNDFKELKPGGIRKVVVADFEEALKHVSHTDFDQGRQYEEWDQQHGSGSGRKGSARSYLTMFL